MSLCLSGILDAGSTFLDMFLLQKTKTNTEGRIAGGGIRGEAHLCSPNYRRMLTLVLILDCAGSIYSKDDRTG